MASQVVGMEAHHVAHLLSGAMERTTAGCGPVSEGIGITSEELHSACTVCQDRDTGAARGASGLATDVCGRQACMPAAPVQASGRPLVRQWERLADREVQRRCVPQTMATVNLRSRSPPRERRGRT
jgi:hypothetical protein